MLIEMYKTISSNNVIGKVKTDLLVKNIKFKGSANIKNPTIKLKTDTTLLEYNYCYIPDFKRYYFINDVTIETDNIMTIELRVDVLESFKNDILNSNASIKKYSVDSNYLNSTDYQNEILKEVDIFKSDVTIKKQNNVIMTIIN